MNRVFQMVIQQMSHQSLPNYEIQWKHQVIELLGIKLGLASPLDPVHNQHIRVELDNTTAASYLIMR